MILDRVLDFTLDGYRNHPSIAKIHKKRNLHFSSFYTPSSSWESKITPKQTKTIFKSLNYKKTPGLYKIPIKLVKLLSEVLLIRTKTTQLWRKLRKNTLQLNLFHPKQILSRMFLKLLLHSLRILKDNKIFL